MQLPSDLGGASKGGMDIHNKEYQKRKSLKQIQKSRADNVSVSSIGTLQPSASQSSVNFQKSKTLDEKTIAAKVNNAHPSVKC